MRPFIRKSVTRLTVCRPMVYAAVADLIHNIKSDLSFEQLTRIVHVYSSLLFNPTLGFNLHILFSKVLFGLADTIVTKDTSQNASKLIHSMFEACLERLEGLCAIQNELSGALERARVAATVGTVAPGKEPPIDGFYIERSRPFGGTLFISDKPEEVLLGKFFSKCKLNQSNNVPECRQLYRALLHGFRVTLIDLKKLDAPSIDGNLAFRLFDSCIRCMSLYDVDPRVNEQNDIIDWLGTR